jgi:hypothetical protein
MRMLNLDRHFHTYMGADRRVRRINQATPAQFLVPKKSDGMKAYTQQERRSMIENQRSFGCHGFPFLGSPTLFLAYTSTLGHLQNNTTAEVQQHSLATVYEMGSLYHTSRQPMHLRWLMKAVWDEKTAVRLTWDAAKGKNVPLRMEYGVGVCAMTQGSHPRSNLANWRDLAKEIVIEVGERVFMTEPVFQFSFMEADSVLSFAGEWVDAGRQWAPVASAGHCRQPRGLTNRHAPPWLAACR